MTRKLAKACAFEGCAEPRHRWDKGGKSQYCKAHRKEAHAKWREMIAAQSAERDARYALFGEAYAQAIEVGQAASDTDEREYFVRVWPATTSLAHYLFTNRVAVRMSGQAGVLMQFIGRAQAVAVATDLIAAMVKLEQSRTRITVVSGEKLAAVADSGERGIEE